MNSFLLEASVLLLLLLLAATTGYVYHGKRDHAELVTAQASVRTCDAALTAKESAVVDLRKMLGELTSQHAQAIAAAEKALDARDGEIATLLNEAASRAAAIRKSVHDDVDCQALDRIPVCAAVAGRLWPAAQQAGTRASANH